MRKSSDDLPEIEQWSTNKLDHKALFEMIEASNAYALCRFSDPVNEIYTKMLMEVAGFIPQLLAAAVEKHKRDGVVRNDVVA